MSKILKSTTLGNVKNGGIFKALGKKFVKLDADEHGCLVLAKDIWTKMPFRDGDDPECPNDLRRSDVMKYLGNCLAEFTEKGTPLDTFIPFKIDLQDTTGQTEYGTVEYRIGLLTLRQYGKYWRLIPKVDTPWWLATPYGTPNCSPYASGNNNVWSVHTDGSGSNNWCNGSYTRKAFKLSAFPSGVITARAKCWPMLPPKLASTEQTFRSRRQCFLRKKRGFWYGMATVPRLSGFVEVTEW